MPAQETERPQDRRPRVSEAKPASSIRVECMPAGHPGKDDAEPWKQRDVVQACKRCRTDAKPEQVPGAVDESYGVTRDETRHTCNDESPCVQPDKERCEQDRETDEVQDTKDDADRGEEQPGYAGYDHTATEDGKTAAGIPDREPPRRESSPGTGITDCKGEPHQEDEGRCGQAGEEPEEPSGDIQRQDAEEVEVEGRMKDDHSHDGNPAGEIDLPVARPRHGAPLRTTSVGQARRSQDRSSSRLYRGSAPLSARCRSGRSRTAGCTRSR